MTDRILLINNKTALLTDALASNLKTEGISIIQAEPTVEKIGKEKNNAEVFLLFAGDFIYNSPDVLVYLKDLCFGEEKLLCVVGYSKEIAEIEEFIPKSLIELEVERPIDVKLLAKSLHKVVTEIKIKTKKKHILLVDDDVMFLQMMQKWLSARYHVTAVKSGMQAITYISAHTPDLILLDYDMPITPGPQILEMIRSEPNSAKIPVIFLTAKSDRDSVIKVMRLNPEGYLLKSLGHDEILNSVDRFFF